MNDQLENGIQSIVEAPNCKEAGFALQEFLFKEAAVDLPESTTFEEFEILMCIGMILNENGRLDQSLALPSCIMILTYLENLSAKIYNRLNQLIQQDADEKRNIAQKNSRYCEIHNFVWDARENSMCPECEGEQERLQRIFCDPPEKGW